MNWASAGMLQGLGQGLSNAGAEAVKFASTSSLDQQRAAMEDKRAERTLAAQQKMQETSLAAQATEAAATRANTSAEAKATRDQFLNLHTVDATERVAAAKARYAQDQDLLREKIKADAASDQTKMGGTIVAAGVHSASQERIHKATNDITLKVADLHLAAATKTATASDIKELNHSLDTLETNITTLQKESNELIADPTSSAYKNIQARLTLLQRSAADARVLLNAKQAVGVALPTEGGTKTITLENYEKAVSEKGQAAVDAFLKTKNIPIPSAKPATGMLGTPSAGAVPNQTVPKLWSYEQK